jgi:2'-5' RNA ligase
VRPVPRGSAHLTHAFLGEVDEALAEVITRDIEEVMTTVAPETFQLGRPELLCAGREPRLVLAPVTVGRMAVEAVTRAIVDRLRRQPAFGRLAPPRSAHVTVARFRRGAGMRDATQVAGLFAGPEIALAWQPDCLAEVQLVRSELTQGGPVYGVVARAGAGRPR